MTLTLGKYRALQRASTDENVFAILALDHQDSLRRVLRPDAPASLSADEITAFKLDVVSAIAPLASGVLLDPVYSAPQSISAGVLNGAGLLVELERADYQMEPLPLDVEIEPAWSVAKIKRMGADGVKLFYYFNPNHADHAARQDALLRQVAADCARWDIPLYAEPIYYRHQVGESRQQAIIDAARWAAAAGADILKLEFPVDVAQELDETRWHEACAAITAAVDRPWVLLSAGVVFDVFARQLEIACRAGASGFMVGRAFWGEVAQLTEVAARRDWLATEGQRRWALLYDIVQSQARAWQALYPAPEVSPQWYQQYASEVCDG